MKCTYINLESRADKKDLIESSFASNKIDGWELVRFNAIDKSEVERRNIPGSLPSGEKGCFLSHRSVIQNADPSLGHLFIVEDDVTFGSTTFVCIDELLNSIPDDWDILFLDICVPVAEGMIQLYQLSKNLKSQGTITLIDLSDKAFGSAASYIVNKKSIKKLSEILGKIEIIDVPIDLILKELVHQSQIKAFVTFPFLTTLSSLSEKSDLQSKETYVTELIWHTFRKLVWNESRRQDYEANLLALKKLSYDEQDEDFILVLKGFLNTSFQGK